MRRPQEAADRRRSPLAVGVALVGLALVLPLLAGAGWVGLDRRARAFAEAEAQGTSLSLALAEHTSRTFQAVDLVLMHVAEKIRAEGAASPAALAEHMGTLAVHQMLRDQVVGLRQLELVGVVGADGQPINTSAQWPIPAISIAQRDYFRALRDTPTRDPVVSSPIPTATGGVRAVFLARRLEAPDGSFMGVIQGAIRLDYFEDFYRALSDGEGRGVSLRRRDGTLLARYIRSEPGIGLNIAGSQILRTIQEGAATAHMFSAGQDGVSRLRVAQALKDFPLILVVSRAESAINAEWWPQAVAIGIGVVAAAAALLATAMLLARQIGRRESSEAALAATLEHMSQGIVMIDRDGHIPVFNKRIMEMLELPASLLTANPHVMDVLRYQIAAGEFGPDGSVNDESIRRYLATRTVSRQAFAYEHRRPNGTVLEIHSNPLPNGGAVRTYTDVTEARTREAVLRQALQERDAAQELLLLHQNRLEREVAARTEALAASETRLREAIETIPEGFVLFDAEYRLVLCNTAYRELYGLAEDAATPGVSIKQLIRASAVPGLASSDADIDRLLSQRLAEHRLAGGASCRSEHRLADGRLIEVRERRTADGGIVGLRIDVTEARQRAASERELDKLAALGQLAGGVAHEINNLLQPALTFPELVRGRLPADDVESREDLEAVLESVRKARDIVRDILVYARKDEPALAPLDLASEIGSALAFVRNVLPPCINLVYRDFPGEAIAAANKTQLTQVLTNLIVNAAHAMNGRGAVTIAIDAVCPDPGAAQALGIRSGQRYFAVTVTDDGCGMDAATMSHIFEPFFTTKPVGHGTGLGLSVAYGILRSWGGAIAVDSAVGRGTTFTLYVPAGAGAAAQAA